MSDYGNNDIRYWYDLFSDRKININNDMLTFLDMLDHFVVCINGLTPAPEFVFWSDGSYVEVR